MFMIVAALEDLRCLRPGDSVRLNLSIKDDEQLTDFVNGKVTNSSVGIFVGECIQQIPVGIINIEQRRVSDLIYIDFVELLLRMSRSSFSEHH